MATGTASDLLKILRGELGTKESPPNSNKVRYAEWAGINGYPWCAAFVSWCLHKVGIDTWRHTYTPAGAQLFIDAGRWHVHKPKPLDVVYFDFPDSVSRIQHVGFVVRQNDDGSLVTIEGNTSSGDAGSQDNGGGVFERVRPMSYVVGFGRPEYNGRVDKPETKPRSKPWFGITDSGADIRHWQKDLNFVRPTEKVIRRLDQQWPEVDVDGNFGRLTARATRAFQALHELDIDTRVGQHDIATMEQVRRGLKEAA